MKFCSDIQIQTCFWLTLILLLEIYKILSQARMCNFFLVTLNTPQTFHTVQKSKDETCIHFSTSLIDLCCTYIIHILNGRLFDNTYEEITCIAINGRSAVDNMSSSTLLFESFSGKLVLLK